MIEKALLERHSPRAVKGLSSRRYSVFSGTKNGIPIVQAGASLHTPRGIAGCGHGGDPGPLGHRYGRLPDLAEWLTFPALAPASFGDGDARGGKIPDQRNLVLSYLAP